MAIALDALTIAPEKIDNSGIYLGLRVGYRRLVNARNDDDLRGVLDYLWQMARAIEDGDMSDAEQRLHAAREALEQALKDGASDEEIARLIDELRQAMQEFLQSYMAEMAASAACRTCRRCRPTRRCRRCPSRICRRCSTASRNWRSSATARPRRSF